MSAPVWPSASDYALAIQDPEHCFQRRDLQRLVIRTGLYGLPASAAGQNAVVFTGGTGTEDWAIRCHTHPPEDGRERMRALEAHLSGQPQSAFLPASWTDQGILVGDRWWPIVLMPWVEGHTLDQAVAERLEEPAELRALDARFVEAVVEMEHSGLAHGDLQHGNVMVTTGADIRFVDYDGVWVADAALAPPHEVGHPNFQHPERARTGAWGAGIDTFSALVIHISLLAVAAEPRLWDKYHTGENLIFTSRDFVHPADSELLEHLFRLGDREIEVLCERLVRAAGQPLGAVRELAPLVRRSDRSVDGGADSSPGQWWLDPRVHLVDGSPRGVPTLSSAAEVGNRPAPGSPVAVRRESSGAVPVSASSPTPQRVGNEPSPGVAAPTPAEAGHRSRGTVVLVFMLSAILTGLAVILVLQLLRT